MFKKFNQHIGEGYGYVKDPFREGESIWVKKIHLKGVAIAQIVASIDGITGIHTAIVSIHTKSMDDFGEDLAAERFIVNQKDFEDKNDAIEYLKDLETKLEI